MPTTQPVFKLEDLSHDLLIQYHRRHYDLMNQQWSLRSAMRLIDLAYLREQDMTIDQWRAKISNKLGDSDKIQNITVPVIRPQIEAAVAYQAAVFLSQYPMFELSASPNEQDIAAQLQALIEENSIRGGWVREFILFFYDAFKYNLSAIEVDWGQEISPVLETDVTQGTDAKVTNILWQGNTVERWDMYNTYWDTRVQLDKVPTEGDFAGTTKIKTRVGLRRLLESLTVKLTDRFDSAFEAPTMLNIPISGSDTLGFCVPSLNPDVLVDYSLIDQDNWDAWAGLDHAHKSGAINYKGVYEISKEYCRIIPAEFNMDVDNANVPQIWKFVIVNHSVVVSAERMTNAHDKIPVLFGAPLEDGLGYQTKSLASNSIPFQQVASAIMNGVLAGRRRAVTDRMIYDPSRISDKHINNPSPTAKIPVRPSAYGKPITDSVYQIPYREDQAATGLQEVQTIIGLSNSLNNQNQARQGQFVKGNKTDTQWESTMSNATSADQLSAQKLEAQVFTPMKEIIKLNYLQYQGGTEVYSAYQQKLVKIDPVALRKAALAFKVTDGLLPKEKVMSTEARKVAMQVIGTSPTLNQGYNVAPLFSYIMKLENVDLRPFEKPPQQINYERAAEMWMQTAQLAIQKGVQFNTPQPTPQQFGWDPNAQNSQSTQTQPAVTNNEVM